MLRIIRSIVFTLGAPILCASTQGNSLDFFKLLTVVNPDESRYEEFKGLVVALNGIKSIPTGRSLVNKITGLSRTFLDLCKSATVSCNLSRELKFTGLDSRSPVKVTGALAVELDVPPNETVAAIRRKYGLSNAVDLVLKDGKFLATKNFGEWFSDEECTSDPSMSLMSYLALHNVPCVQQQTVKDPQLTLFLPASPQDWVDSCEFTDPDVLSKEFAVAVAHELLHMKHFLEERIFVQQVANAIIKMGLKEEFLTRCNLSSALSDSLTSDAIVSFVKDLEKLKQLVDIAKKYSIPTGCPIVLQTSGPQSLKDLPSFPYSAGKKFDTTSLSVLYDDLAKYCLKTFNLDKIDFRTFNDLEEVRTILSPDRDGICENKLRQEFGLPLRKSHEKTTPPS